MMKAKKKFSEIPARSFNPNKTIRVADMLRSLEVGEMIELPADKRCSVQAIAKYLGIKVVTRNLGSKETVNIYREA